MKRCISFLLIIFLCTPFFETSYSNSSFPTNQHLKLNSPIIDDSSTKESNHKKTFTNEELLGSQQYFFGYDHRIGDEKILATLLSIGSHCYFYMANLPIDDMGESAAIAKCDILKNEFDNTIYPIGIQLAGSVDGRLGDIDGDLKVTILLAPMGQYGGCYRFKDDTTTDPFSNQREMVYINVNKNIEDTIKVIAHEFNHLIWGNYEQDEAVFLTEGAADYSLYYLGYLSNQDYVTWEPDYNLSSATSTFMNHPELSLLDWHYTNHELLIADYGQAYMFMFYLAEKYGSEVVGALVEEESDGPKAIEKVLTYAGFNVTFNELYLSWITACTIDAIGFDNNRYGFTNAEFSMTKINNQLYSLSSEIPKKILNYYGFDIIKIISPPDKFTFQVTNSATYYSLGTSIAVHDKNGWSVTQTILGLGGGNAYAHISGESINTAYIITSLITNSTPTYFMKPEVYYPSIKQASLNYYLVAGHVLPVESLTGNSSNFTYFLLSLVIIGVRIISKKKKRNYQE